MRAEAALRAAIKAAVETGPALNGVYLGPPVRATTPYAVVADAPSVDWSTKTEVGRELRPALILRDDAPGGEGLDALGAEAEAAVASMPRDVPGWRIASLSFVRSRLVKASAGPWELLIEWRVRMMEVG